MERIPGSERTREKLKALMEGQSEAEDGRPQLVRLGAQRVLPYDEMYAQRMYARIDVPLAYCGGELFPPMVDGVRSRGH